MLIRFLGTGSAINAMGLGSSILLDKRVLVDVPGGLAGQLHQYGVSLTDIDWVLITHLHGDHVFGLPFLLLEYNLQRRDRDLCLLGPPGLEELVYHLTSTAFSDLDVKRVLSASRPAFHELAEGVSVDMSGISAIPRRVPHGKVETYGFEFRPASGSSFFYAPDIEEAKDWQHHVADVDAAALDATTLDEKVPGHQSLRQLKTLAARYPMKRFFAVHRSRYSVETEDLPSNLVCPSPGDEFDLR